MQDDLPGYVQPYLHDLVTCVCAPATVLSDPDGQLRPGGAQGLLAADVRHLSQLVVAVDGEAPTGIGYRQVSADEVHFVAVLRRLGDHIPDATVRVERRRRVDAGGFRETIAVVNDGRAGVRAALSVRLASDLASVVAVKSGLPTDLVPPVPRRAAPGDPGASRSGAVEGGLPPGPLPTGAGPSGESGDPGAGPSGAVEWAQGSCRTMVSADRVPDGVEVGRDHVVLRWELGVPSRERAEVTLRVVAHGDPSGDAVFEAPRARPTWRDRVLVRSREPALDRLAATALADLAALALADSAAPDDVFIAAGSPWFLTLFGRDSLWAARFTLPLGTDVALGTLRTLARRQGTRHDPATGEQPGKMPHEIRRVVDGVGLPPGGLPPSYYGTIDATPLWISLLHDAWRWGLAPDQVGPLLGPLERALEWVMVHGDPDGDGFLEYHDESGHGLANQGWKDSGDAIQDARGVLAEPPVTLSEAQSYAHRAALDGAALLDAFDRPGAERAVAYASDLEKRFRAAFWVDEVTGSFPAVALDRDKQPVDALTSNIGHLLGSGLLSADETGIVAAWLADPRLDSGHGVRTLDVTHPRFNPLGYHTGSVWPHDTAIAILGLMRSGHGAAAASLATGLVGAADRFQHRLPELFGGWSDDQGPLLAYPAACRPQAWAAAAVIVLMQAALGLEADVPARRLRVRPADAFAAWFPLSISGLEVAGRPLAVDVDRDGRAIVSTTAPLDVDTR